MSLSESSSGWRKITERKLFLPLVASALIFWLS